MKPMEEALYQLLNQHITIEDETVPIMLGYAEIDSTPCITIATADETFQRRRYVEIQNKQYLQKRYSTDVWINVWANMNKQRHELVQQVNNRILQAEANHHTTCKHYNLLDQTCKITESTCESITNTGQKHRPHKGQCPDLNKYCSFFKTHNIIKNTFYIDGVTDLDELDLHDPILRTIIKTKMNYYIYYMIGGDTYEHVSTPNTLI